jgi:hypothetical protein
MSTPSADTCTKCGSTDISLRFMARKGLLHARCRVCEYGWNKAPLDNPDANVDVPANDAPSEGRSQVRTEFGDPWDLDKKVS